MLLCGLSPRKIPRSAEAQVNPDSAPWLENECLVQVVGGEVRGQEDSVVGVEQE